MFNYNTGEKVTAIEAHPDYIRCLAVHPTQPLVLTGSDDMTIKLWDWEKGWKCIQVSSLSLSFPFMKLLVADEERRRLFRCLKVTLTTS